MGWKLKGSPKTVKITSRLAKEWADMDAAHIDRPLSERRLMVHRNTYRKGGFRPVLWARAYCKELEDWYRVNGKHTSTLFASEDLGRGQDLYATIEEYECDTVEDMAKLYATFDSQVQSRTSTDINMSFAAAIPELKDVDAKIINICVGALNWIVSASPGGGKLTAMEKAEAMFDNIDFVLFIDKMINGVIFEKSIHLRRVPVVKAMLDTYRKAKAAATEFWLAVRDETGEKPDLPDRKLAKFLVQMRLAMGTGRGTIPDRFRITPREFYYKSITAWNAWRKGASTDLKYFPNAKLPAIG
jgi:hypothetical protein